MRFNRQPRRDVSPAKNIRGMLHDAGLDRLRRLTNAVRCCGRKATCQRKQQRQGSVVQEHPRQPTVGDNGVKERVLPPARPLAVGHDRAQQPVARPVLLKVGRNVFFRAWGNEAP